jgi:hypothetical protein
MRHFPQAVETRFGPAGLLRERIEADSDIYEASGL